MPSEFVKGAPDARTALLRGMEQMTALLRPTLGPVARTVAIAGATGSSAPEVLDSAATIARRTIQLSEPFEDMGAMIVRQLAWTVFKDVGDGSATAAVLCQEIMHAASPYVATGGSPTLIKLGFEQGLRVATDEVRRQARKIDLPMDLARMVAGTLREPGLAEMVGEIVETIGVDGTVLIENAHGTTTGHEYVEGVQWDSGYLSYFLSKGGEEETQLLRPRILLTDKKLSAEELSPVVETCVNASERTLLVIAPSLSDSALALLALNRDRGVLYAVMAAKAPLHGMQREEVLFDLAAITGGRYIRTVAGDQVSRIILEDLGTAHRAWVTRQRFGIIGGGGARGPVRERVNEAKAQLRGTNPDDSTRRTIMERIGKLMGAVAIIRVGAPTDTARAELRSRVEAAVTAARTTYREGGVPGGGAAFVACVPALERLASELDGDEAFGVAVLVRALSAPLRTIARNAGADPNLVAAEARRRPPGYTYDATTHTWVDAWASGIVDPLPVTLAVLQGSISAATMALTTDVLVRHKTPPHTITP